MLKSIIGGVVGFVAALAVVYTSNPAHFDGRIPTMKDGSYTVYSIQKKFGTRTGEPVYWMVGGKGYKTWFSDVKAEAYIEPNETSLFEIPRNKLVGLAEADVPGAPDVRDYRVDVANDIARVVRR